MVGILTLSLIPNFMEQSFIENHWEHKTTIEAKQYVERIHGDNDGTDGPTNVKDGIGDDRRFIDMTSINIKNSYSKDNVYSFDEYGNWGINAVITSNIGAGIYRGDTTGKNEKHNFARLVLPFISVGMGVEGTLAYNGNEKFKPEIGLKTRGEIHGRLYGEIDAVAKLSSQITDKDKISGYYAKSLYAGAYYPFDVAGIKSGGQPYGKGEEIGLGYERKISNGRVIGVEAFYRKIDASKIKNGQFEPDNITTGIRFSFNY